MTVKFDRVVMVVIDGLGVGSAPDADVFTDQGADTLGRLVHHFRARLQLPNLVRLGLSQVHPLFNDGGQAPDHVCYGRARPAAIGKTAMESWWELLGVPTKTELTACPQGLAPALAESLANEIHCPLIGNQPATPLNALAHWGSRQQTRGGVIMFTSGGSDLWLAAHETTLSKTALRQIGQQVRRWLDRQPGIDICQLITIPFTGVPVTGYHYRWSAGAVLPMMPPGVTMVDQLRARGIPVRQLAGDDQQTWQRLQNQLVQYQTGVWVARLRAVDQAGYRRNPEQMGQRLAAVDQALGELLPSIGEQDLLLVTAAHGNDPDFPGAALTREWVPILAYSPCLTGRRLAERASLADVAALILDNFGSADCGAGESFLTLLK